MLDEGFSASSASFEVGYESVSQFTREYRRMFQAPPKRDALRARCESSNIEEQTQGAQDEEDGLKTASTTAARQSAVMQ